MTFKLRRKEHKMPQSAKQEPNWAGVYKLGGVAVLVTVLVGIH